MIIIVTVHSAKCRASNKQCADGELLQYVVYFPMLVLLLAVLRYDNRQEEHAPLWQGCTDYKSGTTNTNTNCHILQVCNLLRLWLYW